MHLFVQGKAKNPPSALKPKALNEAVKKKNRKILSLTTVLN